MRIGIVGAGISGMASAWFLQSSHTVTLFERAPQLGGHAQTVSVECEGKTVHVDLGFKYIFDTSYPYLFALLRLLGIRPRWVDGSVTIVSEDGRTQVLPPRSLRHLDGLLRSPKQLRNLWWLSRFLRAAKTVTDAADWSLSVAELLHEMRSPADFGDQLLYPFLAASWGAPLSDMPHFPAYDVFKVIGAGAGRIGFFQIDGGAGAYIQALGRELGAVDIRLGVGVARIHRRTSGYYVEDEEGRGHEFDLLILATPAHVAADLLASVQQAREQHEVLTRFRHFPANIVVHSDPRLMPRQQSDWSTCNHFHGGSQPFMTEWTGSQQRAPVFRTWLPAGRPEPRYVHHRKEYRHLIVSKDNRAWQQRLAALQGRADLFFVGMYTIDVDDHESALMSAVVAARALAPESPNLRSLEAAVKTSGAHPTSTTALRRVHAALSGQARREKKNEGGKVRWTNWVGNQVAYPERIFEPQTREDLVAIVREARARRRKIRVCGESHTFAGFVPTDEIMVNIGKLRKVRVERDSPIGPVVTMEAGATVADVDAALLAAGLVIPTNVVLTSVRYGGLIAMGCHGSGYRQPPLSDFVVAMEVVDGLGEVRTFSDATIGPEAMDAARLSLGLFGIIHTITMRAVPIFNVHHVDDVRSDMHKTLRDIRRIVTQSDYCDLYWFPFTQHIWLKTYNRTTAQPTVTPARIRAERLGQYVGMQLGQRAYQQLVQNPRYTPAACRVLSKMMPSRNVIEPVLGGIHFQTSIEFMRVRNMEVGFAIDEDFHNVQRAWQVAIELIERYARQNKWPLNVTLNARFIGQSRALLSPCHGMKQICFMEIMSFQGTPDWDEFVAELGGAWLELPGAAPHWPKEFEQIPGVFEKIRARYGSNLTRFAAIRRELGVDPDDLFVNELTGRILKLADVADVAAAAGAEPG